MNANVFHQLWGQPELSASSKSQCSEYERLLALGMIEPSSGSASASNEACGPSAAPTATTAAKAAAPAPWNPSTPAERAAHAHAHGYCTPCRFIAKDAHCHRGNDCRFCHEPHTTQTSRPRPNKGMRVRCKRMVNSSDISTLLSSGARPAEFVQDQPKGSQASTRDRYLMEIMRATVRQQVEQGNAPEAEALAVFATGTMASDAAANNEWVEGQFSL
eukprot:NODE_14965_length_1075_cov_11.140295.p1 GENE.NODE_14965_length_1075_cov_11.140295~~NODE_14965_length_1075_cov_11.140295.p1  ORF type:complete len:217 (+),score=10.79 NODE_14965_length_1075_cov_11.140295:212-862(+)